MKIDIIYSDYCDHCHELITKLKEQNGIDNIDLNYIELGSPEAQQHIKTGKIDRVPVAINEQGIHCTIGYLDGKIDIACPEDS